mmetsp:Transcript_26188/g.43691  ORF Transcript_26188/g.43691 Transcript_26188/m.43691 type:complete len:222 (+) Transcript_26188:195-860(+)|eukprot:CAMPEP_0119014682 /NCGR_PEP_ID=MMETSP1176-20130426/10199_1 /TAXON_ID=265551 /ORGANISM="Synedropsis recta cf, Strain CCMP1620" /LENGTH=221 /DNA_ID=CAMNT_0006967903 /DNA_START=183 /DNA_END=848 /DNA_ORIENTATION=+
MTEQKDKSRASKSFENLIKVKDHVPVGLPEILKSPHVSEGPGRIANSPVPSIFQDDRGEIHRLRVGHRRMNVLYSKEGVMRSGYLHPHKMNDFVVSGKVEVWTLSEAGTLKTPYGAQEFFVLDPYTPHILHFLEDTVILEFWDGPFSCWYYHPYRRLVQLQNSLVENTTGLLQHLVPQDNRNESSGSNRSSLFWWSAGVVMGIAVGAVLATTGGRGRRFNS